MDSETLMYLAWVEKINYQGFIDSGMFEDRPRCDIGQMSSNLVRFPKSQDGAGNLTTSRGT